ncbi:hypothetical protein [Hanstruepera ponticola]|uniref:hypothetical protein n=1 Tax=Hanstruepera ponticola TaxID=2042995 RepID=UPI00177D3D99|nr:hypothetical protein [Hanstruepera ponticola]
MNVNKKLVELVFQKAKNDSGLEVMSQLANHVVTSIEEDFNFIISDRALRNYYNEVYKKNKKTVSISGEIANYLARFLNYEDYSSFEKDHIVIKEKKQKNMPQKAVIGGLVVLASYFGYEATAHKCMAWVDNTRYEKTNCENVNTVPIDERLLSHFNRVEPDSSYKFFKEDGSPNLWYGKSINGDYEYFNNYGMHPITGKTLKGITKYIIDKHVLKK